MCFYKRATFAMRFGKINWRVIPLLTGRQITVLGDKILIRSNYRLKFYSGTLKCRYIVCVGSMKYVNFILTETLMKQNVRYSSVALQRALDFCLFAQIIRPCKNRYMLQ